VSALPNLQPDNDIQGTTVNWVGGEPRLACCVCDNYQQAINTRAAPRFLLQPMQYLPLCGHTGSQCFDEGDRGNWADRWFHSVCGRDWRCTTADADKMRTQNFGILHISSSHPCWEDMHYDISLTDKRRPSMLLCVAGLTSSHGPHVCPSTWLGDSPSLCAEGTNILLLIATPVPARSNQLCSTQCRQ